MFAKHELLAGLRALTAVSSPPLEVVEFGSDYFISSSSEQSICAVRGARADFSSGLLFWVKALEGSGGPSTEPYITSYAEGALCEPIGPSEFARVVDEYSGSLQFPLPKFVGDLAGWRSGLRMYADWNLVVLVSELADSFVMFQWMTTA